MHFILIPISLFHLVLNLFYRIKKTYLSINLVILNRNIFAFDTNYSVWFEIWFMVVKNLLIVIWNRNAFHFDISFIISSGFKLVLSKSCQSSLILLIAILIISSKQEIFKLQETLLSDFDLHLYNYLCQQVGKNRMS